MKIIPEQNKRGLELDFSNLRVLCVYSLSIFFPYRMCLEKRLGYDVG